MRIRAVGEGRRATAIAATVSGRFLPERGIRFPVRGRARDAAFRALRGVIGHWFTAIAAIHRVPGVPATWMCHPLYVSTRYQAVRDNVTFAGSWFRLLLPMSLPLVCARARGTDERNAICLMRHPGAANDFPGPNA